MTTNRLVTVALSLACALAAAFLPSVGCGGDGTTPDCSSPEAGCGVLVEASIPFDGPAATDGAPDASPPLDAGAADAQVPDGSHDGAGADAHDASIADAKKG